MPDPEDFGFILGDRKAFLVYLVQRLNILVWFDLNVETSVGKFRKVDFYLVKIDISKTWKFLLSPRFVLCFLIVEGLTLSKVIS